MSTTPRQPSRRTVATGVAWALPAVGLAAAAPSLAASAPGDGPSTPTVDTTTSFAEKCPGESAVPGGWPKQGYRLVLIVTPASAPAPLITSVVLGNGKAGEVLPIGPTRLGGGAWEYVVAAQSSPSSLTVTYTIGDRPVLSATVPASPH